MTSYMLEVVIDGKPSRVSLSTMPQNIVVRFYSVPDAPEVVLLAEKVLK